MIAEPYAKDEGDTTETVSLRYGKEMEIENSSYVTCYFGRPDIFSLYSPKRGRGRINLDRPPLGALGAVGTHVKGFFELEVHSLRWN